MNTKKWNYDLIVALIFGVLAAVTIIIQISTSTKFNSPLVTTLFNVLQFIFSIVFAWLLTRFSSKKDFEDTQRGFAIAAYRRMLQLRETVRFLKYKLREKGLRSTELKSELESIESLAFSIEQTINSSVSDWADVISDEISIIRELERLKTEQEIVLYDQKLDGLDRLYKDSIGKILDTYQTQIEALTKRLPPSLQTSSEDDDNPALYYKENIEKLIKELGTKGFLEFSGFWDSSFDKDIMEYHIGDKLYACVDDVNRRNGALIVRGLDGKSIGVLTNKVGGKYSAFVMAVVEVINKSKFELIITEIESKTYASGRHYFKVHTAQLNAQLPSQINAT
jgi:hypothetical protein